MALLDIKMRSQCLGKDVSLNVIFPDVLSAKNDIKVLWLLHGMRHDYSSWCRFTSIEHYVTEKNVCVIMPGADLSYYTDMIYGGRYYSYITDELPDKMSGMLNININRNNNYVAGLSMGGYGAFKIALNNSEMYSKVASMSGVLDLEQMYDIRSFDEDLMLYLSWIYRSRDKFKNSINDLVYMASIRKDDTNLPKLYMCCGKNDFLYGMNVDYKEHLDRLGIPVTYEEDESCSHNWTYWDKKIQRVLDWMEI